MNFPLRTAFAASQRFWVVFSLSFVFRNFLISLLISSVTGWLFRNVLFKSPCVCVSYSFFLVIISSLMALWLEKMLDTISIFLNLLRFDLWPKMWSILENVPCALEKQVYSAFEWNVWRYQWDPSHLMYHLRFVFPY